MKMSGMACWECFTGVLTDCKELKCVIQCTYLIFLFEEYDFK